MAQPRAYTRQANFTDHTTESPSDPQVGSKLDSEFDALNLTSVPRHSTPPPGTPRRRVQACKSTHRENGWRSNLGTASPPASLLADEKGQSPLECWCLSSAKFALSRVVILQRDGVFQCVPPGYSPDRQQLLQHLLRAAADLAFMLVPSGE